MSCDTGRAARESRAVRTGALPLQLAKSAEARKGDNERINIVSECRVVAVAVCISVHQNLSANTAPAMPPCRKPCCHDLLRSAAWAALVVGCVGHGAMTFPRPRNSLDGALAPW